MFYITDWSAFSLNARGRKECCSLKSCKSQRMRKWANRKRTVNVSSLAVKADQRHGLQFVQRSLPAQTVHCLKATNKLVRMSEPLKDTVWDRGLTMRQIKTGVCILIRNLCKLSLEYSVKQESFQSS